MPSEHLHAQLRQLVNDIRSRAVAQREARRPAPLPYQPNSIVITAKRNQFGGERAQITTSRPPVKGAKAVPAGKVTPVDRQAIQARIADLMREIRLTEAQGRPSEALRQQLYEAVEAQK